MRQEEQDDDDLVNDEETAIHALDSNETENAHQNTKGADDQQKDADRRDGAYADEGINAVNIHEFVEDTTPSQQCSRYKDGQAKNKKQTVDDEQEKSDKRSKAAIVNGAHFS